jgi:hypothetical protein
VVIFGEAIGSNLNPIPALGSYAAILRRRGEPLHYPAGRGIVIEGVDADLLADASSRPRPVWAVRDEIFIANGDVFSLENDWPVLADAFGMEVGGHQPTTTPALVSTIKARQAGSLECMDTQDKFRKIDRPVPATPAAAPSPLVATRPSSQSAIAATFLSRSDATAAPSRPSTPIRTSLVCCPGDGAGVQPE